MEAQTAYPAAQKAMSLCTEQARAAAAARHLLQSIARAALEATEENRQGSLTAAASEAEEVERLSRRAHATAQRCQAAIRRLIAR